MRYLLELIKFSFFVVAFLFKCFPLFSGTEMLFPMDLYEIPFADKQGIILNVKNVAVHHIEALYNAALTKDKNGNYLLIFRYDIKKKRSFKHNYIACVKLDERLEQKEDFKNIDSLSDFSNDPRILKAGSQYYLVYNDTVSLDTRARIMKIAELNMSNFQLNYITDLDRKIKKTEKNWIPFSYRNGSAEEIYFIYTIDPYNVLKLENPRENTLKDMNFDSKLADFPWSWGTPRGGTHAELVDGEYLTFFHSSFTDRNRKRWYVMGAFTFEAHPPFRITAVSPYPLLFKGIYSSPHAKGSSSRLRCIYPSGLVLTEDNSKILVSCGENDSAVKIVTFDKEMLLKSLIRVDSSQMYTESR
jgi:predicted GH43/DUF377 family glycosyl hydrolase